MNLILVLTYMLGAIHAMVIDPVSIGDMNNRISLQTLKEIKNNLATELKSLFSPLKEGTQYIINKANGTHFDSSDVVILPSKLLNSDIFEKIGMDFLNKESYSFNLNGQDFIIPKDFKNLFLFNTSKPLSIPTADYHNFSKFIDESLPFDMPSYMNLMNHYLVLPKRYIQSKLNLSSNDTNYIFNKASVFSRSILTSPIAEFPVFRSIISENKPLMVFMFSDSDSTTYQKIKNPIMNIKNYLKQEKFIFSNFFDKFASDWIRNISYDSLISSVFCTTNANNLTDSYCLQIHDKSALFLFPAFYDISHLLKQNKPKSLSKREEVEAQAIRQVHDKLSAAADKFNDVTYELVTQPKQVIERVDERIDQKWYGLGDKIDGKKDSIEDKKDNLKQKMVSTVDLFKDKLGVVKDLQSDDFDLDDNSYRIGDSKISKRDHQERQSLFTLQPEGGFIFPLSLIRVEEQPLESPRHKEYSQVMINNNQPRLFKRFSIFSGDENCEKITWYNVFHHSIFGKPKFCIENP